MKLEVENTVSIDKEEKNLHTYVPKVKRSLTFFTKVSRIFCIVYREWRSSGTLDTIRTHCQPKEEDFPIKVLGSPTDFGVDHGLGYM